MLKRFWEEKGPSTSSRPSSRRRSPTRFGLAGRLLGWLDQPSAKISTTTSSSPTPRSTGFTGTAGSSIRLYFENARSGYHPSEPTTTPIALAMAEGDFKSIRRFCERDHENIVSWKQLDAPARGHYTAHTATEALAADIRRFFATLD